MSGEFQALMIPVAGKPYTREVRGELRDLQELIGGHLEAVTLDEGGDAALYFDEEGKLKGRGHNPVATALVDHFYPGFRTRDFIAGDALLVGSNEEGDEVDAPESVQSLVWVLWRAVTDRG